MEDYKFNTYILYRMNKIYRHYVEYDILIKNARMF